MLLFLLRHGQAGNNFPTDFERELTDAGRAASRSIGLLCRTQHVQFTHVFSSPLIRARQTAEAVMENVTGPAVELSEHLTPESDPRILLEFLRTLPASARVLLVTHEPFVSGCIAQLVSDGHALISMKPSSFACIETYGAPARGSGTLRWLIAPELLPE